MVFSSTAFLFAFLPVTLVLYFLPVSFKNKKREIGKKNLVLLVTSLVFYAWGEPVYVLLMLISIFFNYVTGIDIYTSKKKGRNKTAAFLFVLSVAFNLFLLGYFKYSGFVVDNINSIFGTDITNRQLPLPVGISFYTFQILSYVIDVYKGKVKAQKKLIPFASYITMFPQLIAGPIVQYSDIEKQLSDRKINKELFCEGVLIFIRGLGKKVIFANPAGKIYTDLLLTDISTQSMTTAWFGILCYTLQIYFDFSGYSDMAIGLGKMLGFDFVKNFNFPYSATSITDFWRRWHISLSSWFRDYVYIPLGGNRKGKFRNILNILIVWSLTGMWHGASWNFIAWGSFYGVLLIAEKFVLGSVVEKIPTAVRRVVTMVIVMVGWVFFSNINIGDAFTYLGAMAGINGNLLFDGKAAYLIACYGFPTAVMCLSSIGFFDRLPKIRNKTADIAVRGIFYAVVFILSIAFLLSETYNPFLYFRF